MKYYRKFDYTKSLKELTDVFNAYTKNSGIFSIDLLPNGKNNLNFLVLTQDGKFVIKKTKRDKEKILEEHRISKILHSDSLPLIQPLQFRDNSTIFSKDGFNYIIFRYIK